VNNGFGFFGELPFVMPPAKIIHPDDFPIKKDSIGFVARRAKVWHTGVVSVQFPSRSVHFRIKQTFTTQQASNLRGTHRGFLLPEEWRRTQLRNLISLGPRTLWLTGDEVFLGPRGKETQQTTTRPEGSCHRATDDAWRSRKPE
jgi:hypothetical protein